MKPAGQIKRLHSQRALFCTTLAVNLMGVSRFRLNSQFLSPDLVPGSRLRLRLKSS